jgi:prepilin-type N-terminal cleavage/methylation domain-containing protein
VILKSQSGMTLIEVMLTVALIGIFAFGAMKVLTDLTNNAQVESRIIDLEVERLTMESQIQQIFGQAMYLVSTNATIPVANNIGRIRDTVNLIGPKLNAADPDIETLAVFFRDTGVSGPAASGIASNPLPTAVYFQRPTANTWGVLYISLGIGTPPNLAPSRSDLFYEGLLGLRITNLVTYNQDGSAAVVNGNPVTSFDLELTFRRFLGPAGGRKSFCRQAQVTANVAGCAIDGPFRDDLRVVRVTMRNNVIAESPTEQNSYSRVFDTVHFFQAQRPN